MKRIKQRNETAKETWSSNEEYEADLCSYKKAKADNDVIIDLN